MLSIPVDVVTEVIALLGVIFTAMWGTHASRKLKQAEHQMAASGDVLPFGNFFTEVFDMDRGILSVLDNTNIDSFSLFIATNGVMEPRWTTNVYQRRQGYAPMEVVHYRLDEDAVIRIRQARKEGCIRMRTADLPPCQLKKICELSGITESVWYYVGSYAKAQGVEQTTLCVYGTMLEQGLTDICVANASVSADSVRHMYENYENLGKR